MHCGRSAWKRKSYRSTVARKRMERVRTITFPIWFPQLAIAENRPADSSCTLQPVVRNPRVPQPLVALADRATSPSRHRQDLRSAVLLGHRAAWLMQQASSSGPKLSEYQGSVWAGHWFLEAIQGQRRFGVGCPCLHNAQHDEEHAFTKRLFEAPISIRVWRVMCIHAPTLAAEPGQPASFYLSQTCKAAV